MDQLAWPQGSLLYTTWEIYDLTHLGLILDMPKQLRKASLH